MPELDHDYTFKLILLGDSGVGKSSTLLQFMEKGFNESHQSTIGIEFGSNTVKYNHLDKEKSRFEVLKIKLTCWDCAGQDRYRTVVKSYYRNTAGIILVFDLTRRETLQSLEFWIKELEEVRGSDMVPAVECFGVKRYPPILLVGNKKDLIPEDEVDRATVVSKEEALEFVRNHCLDGYIETSAKTGENVAIVFKEMARIIYSHVYHRGSGLEGVIDPNNQNPKWYELEAYRPKSNCCNIV